MPEEDTLEDMVQYKGWMVKKRKHGSVLFLDMHVPQFPGQLFQVVASKDAIPAQFDSLASLAPESAITVEGKLVKNSRAPTGEELQLKKYEIIQIPTEAYPLATKEHSPETLLEWRYLAVRGTTYQKIWLVREESIRLFGEFFHKNNWHAVSPPMLSRSACEGGSTLFEVKYFDNTKAYLSQSAQLYLEAMIYSLGSVWSLTPSFRAEKSRTPRHLAEFWHLEGESAFCDFDGIVYVIQNLMQNKRMKQHILDLGGNVSYFETIKAPFDRLTYDAAVKILHKKTPDFKWGDDFGAEDERILFEHMKKPFFITHYPTAIKAFYVKEESNRPEICRSADLIVDIGELTTGGQREEDITAITARIKKEGLDIKDYSWYLDLRKYGSVPHAGFGLGVERFTQWITGQHIRDTIPFPRSARMTQFI